jgi:hypothetical protein
MKPYWPFCLAVLLVSCAMSTSSIAQETAVITSVLHCDHGNTMVKQAVYPGGSLLTIRSLSGNTYFVPQNGDVYSFAFQPSYSSVTRGIAIHEWLRRVAKEAPNAYAYYERQQNDCVGEKN